MPLEEKFEQWAEEYKRKNINSRDALRGSKKPAWREEYACSSANSPAALAPCPAR